MVTPSLQAALYSVIYASSATKPFSKADLVTLLEVSRRNNTRDGVTGMLVYKDGNFMQAIEGEEGTIRKLHAKIQNDPRHHGLITLLEGPQSERQFTSWSMGFQDLTDASLRERPGYSEFLNTPLNSKEFSDQPNKAQKLLLSFKSKM